MSSRFGRNLGQKLTKSFSKKTKVGPDSKYGFKSSNSLSTSNMGTSSLNGSPPAEHTEGAPLVLPENPQVSAFILALPIEARPEALERKIEELEWQLETETILQRKLETINLEGRPAAFLSELEAQKQAIKNNIEGLGMLIRLHKEQLDQCVIKQTTDYPAAAPGEIETLSSSIVSLKNELENKAHKLEEKEKEAGRYTMELELLREKYNDLERTHRQLIERHHSLEGSLDQEELDSTATRLTLAMAAISALTREKEEHNRTLADIQTQSAKLKECLESVEMERDALRGEVDCLREQVANLNTAFVADGSESELLRAELSKLQLELAQKHEESSEIRHQLEQKTSMINELMLELEKSRGDARAAEDNLKETTVLEEEISRLKKAVEEKEKMAAQRTKDLDVLRVEMGTLKTMAVTSEATIVGLREKVASLTSTLEEREGQVRALTDTLAQRDTEMQSARSELEHLRSAQAELESLRTRSSETESQLTNRIKELQADLEAKSRLVEDHVSTITGLRSSLEESSDERQLANVKLRDELADARRVNESMAEKLRLYESDRTTKDGQIADLTEAIRAMAGSRDRDINDVTARGQRELDRVRAELAAANQQAARNAESYEQRLLTLEKQLAASTRLLADTEKELEYQRQTNIDLNCHLMKAMEEKMDMAMQVEQWQHDMQAVVKAKDKTSMRKLIG
eukprot:comp88767_c0_seq1/m.48534 comp88767_c0_seq1/g.48534  ORF comp88767_c0_seq1/g.48534 comp88767_c0_seq1/m.48534 type:complete len:691 (-) comp88767_c0_seq1:133-2205(-)